MTERADLSGQELLGVETLNTEFMISDGVKFSVEVPFEDFSVADVSNKLTDFTQNIEKLLKPLGG